MTNPSYHFALKDYLKLREEFIDMHARLKPDEALPALPKAFHGVEELIEVQKHIKGQISAIKAEFPEATV